MSKRTLVNMQQMFQMYFCLKIMVEKICPDSEINPSIVDLASFAISVSVKDRSLVHITIANIVGITSDINKFARFQDEFEAAEQKWHTLNRCEQETIYFAFNAKYETSVRTALLAQE